MEWWRWWLLVAAVVVMMGRGVQGYPEEDLVVGLPGQPKVGFRQYAGYVDVDDKAGRSLFYYFAEADCNAEKKPLTLWLNGGLSLHAFHPSIFLFAFCQSVCMPCFLAFFNSFGQGR